MRSFETKLWRPGGVLHARIAERANMGRAKVRAAIELAERLEIVAIEIAPDQKRVIINRCVTSRCGGSNLCP